MHKPKSDAMIERILIVAAHPDDADFGLGGTVAKWTDAGIAVTLLCVTRGEQGARPGADISGIPALREQEQRAASAEVGITDVRFLDGYRDGWLEPTFELQRDIVAVIRDVRPQRLVCQSPERIYTRMQASHPDHLAAGEASLRAAYPAAENPIAWPELGLPFHHVGEIWLMAHPKPDHAIDITDTFDRKLAALRRHVSQTGHRGEELDEFLRRVSGRMAESFGLPEGRLAEVFAIVPLN
ncbi:MAG: PIG-L deacetylase family protein [Tetrasphaera sp.]